LLSNGRYSAYKDIKVGLKLWCMVQKNKIILACGLLVFLFAFIIYLDSLRNGFLAGDDEEIILRNIYLRDWRNFYKFFTRNLKDGSGVVCNYYRPFQLLIYGIIVKTIGIKPWPFHFASILFHALCGLLLYLLFLRLFYHKANLTMLTLMALLWLSLPIHNEELAGATGLASPTYTFWMLLGILSFLYYGDRQKFKWYIISLLSFILSLFSKESAVIFPGLLLGVYLACVKAGILKKMPFKRFVTIFLPFCIITFIYIVLRLTLLNFSNTLNFYSEANIFTESFFCRIYTLFPILVRGLVIIFFPVGLHPEKSWPVFINFFIPQVVLSFLILAILVILAVIYWNKRPLFTLGIFWFFFSYFPMSNLIAKINALVWDHWLYTPSIGILLSLTTLMEKRPVQKFAYFFLIIMIIIFTPLTYVRSRYYRDTESVSRFILSYEPGSAKTWNNLGIALAEKNKYQEAIDSYTKAIEVEDIYPQTHHNLANAYIALGKYDLAEKEYLKAIEMDSHFFHSYLALGKFYLSRGQREKAREFFKKTLDIYPDCSEAKEFLKDNSLIVR